MGMYVFVYAIKPTDEKYEQMCAIWEACKTAKISAPAEVYKFFNGMAPDPQGIVTRLPETGGPMSIYSTDTGEDRFDIDLTQLDKDVKIIRVTLAY